jgi:hypothetical protein
MLLQSQQRATITEQKNKCWKKECRRDLKLIASILVSILDSTSQKKEKGISTDE